MRQRSRERLGRGGDKEREGGKGGGRLGIVRRKLCDRDTGRGREKGR
jgi:hypothetical protein